MLLQQMQRPTRLLAVLMTTALVYLCYNYLQRLEFVTTCGERNIDGPFGSTRLLSARPAASAKKPTAKIGKVGVAVNALDIPVVHRAFKTHEVHNEMHGYPHFIADQEVVSDLIDNDHFKRGAGAYTKPAYMLAIMIAELLKPEDERLEWLFWFDGDTMVLNPSTPLEIYLPPNTTKELEDVHLIIAANWDGLNSGAFALRVHKWSVSLLSGVLGYPMYERERTKGDRFRDQSAFQFLLGNEDSPLANDRFQHRNHWAEVPMRWFNSLPVNNAFYRNGNWLFSKEMSPDMFDNGTDQVFDDGQGPKVQRWKVMRGDFLVHFAGTKNVRDSWMGPWLDRAEALLPEWNNATYSAQLADEIKTFWADYAGRAKRIYAEPTKEEIEQKEREKKEKEEKAKQDKERQEMDKQEKEQQEKAKQEKENQQKEKQQQEKAKAEQKPAEGQAVTPSEAEKEAEAKALEHMAEVMETSTTAAEQTAKPPAAQ